MTQTICGRHAVIEALAKGNCVHEVLIATNAAGPEIEQVKAQAGRQGVPYHFVHPDKVRQVAGQGEHQGVVARMSAVPFRELDEFLQELGTRPGVIVLLDGVTNPKNVGLIARSAAAAGALGLVVGARGTAPAEELAVHASAGLILRLPMIRVRSLTAALTRLQKAGFWTYALEARADQQLYDVNWGDRVVLVVGDEHEGLSAAVRKAVDALVAIPLADGVDSLNVAVAASVALFEIRRRARQP